MYNFAKCFGKKKYKIKKKEEKRRENLIRLEYLNSFVGLDVLIVSRMS